MASDATLIKNQFNLRSFYTNIMKQNALLYKYQFIVQFGGPDIQQYGFVDQTDPSKNITYYMQSATIPGFSLQNGKTTFLGTQFNIPGVLKYGHDWSPNILLDQNLYSYKALDNWRRAISSLQIDGGGIKVIPNAYARVSLLSTDHQYCTHSFILEGIWISKLGKLDFKYDANGGENVMKIPVSFKYQYVYPDPNFNLDGDPLKA